MIPILSKLAPILNKLQRAWHTTHRARVYTQNVSLQVYRIISISLT